MSVGRNVAAIALTIVAVATLVFFLPRKVHLIVDNTLTQPVRIFLNGEDRGVVKPEESRTLVSIPAGEVKLTAHIVGPEGQRGHDLAPRAAELTAPLFRKQRRAYIWSVHEDATPPTYWILAYGYGDRVDERVKPEAYVPPGSVFAIPGTCEPLLNEFPEQVQLPAGEKGALRLALFADHRYRRLVMEKEFSERFKKMGPLRIPDGG